VIAIGDFRTREAAEEVYAKIVGVPFNGSYAAHPALRLRNATPGMLEGFFAIKRLAEKLANEEGDPDALIFLISEHVRGALSQATDQ